MSVTDSSSSLYSGNSVNTFSPRSSSHVGTSSSSFGVSSVSNNSSTGSTKSMELGQGVSASGFKKEMMNEDKNHPNIIIDRSVDNSQNNVSPTEDVNSLPLYPKSPIHNQSEEMLCPSQDLFEGGPKTTSYATSTPFINLINKQKAHFSSLQLSNESTKSNMNISGQSNQSKPNSLPHGENIEKKLQFESPESFSNSIKKVDHFNSLQLSGELLGRKMDTSAPADLCKPQLLSSPSDVVEKLDFNSPVISGGMASEKDSNTLDIPIWCKVARNDSDSSSGNEIIHYTSDRKLESSACIKDTGGNVFSKDLSNSYDEDSNKQNGSYCAKEKDSSIPTNSVDIFIPVVSQVEERTPVDGEQKDYLPNSFDENLPDLKFELSQPDSPPPVKKGFLTVASQEYIDFAKEKEIQEAPTCSKDLKPTESEGIRMTLSSALSGTTEPKGLSNSFSVGSKYDMNDSFVYKPDMPVFALWNKVFYPGVVTAVVDSATLTIHFHDDQVVTMPKKNVFFHQLMLSYGQKCRVKGSDEFYNDATIMSAFKHADTIHYTILVGDELIVVDRNSLCFTQVQRDQILAKANHTSFKRRRTEPDLSLSSGSDSYFIAKTPAKKLRQSHKLFEGLTFHIIPEDTPVLCSSIVLSSMEEEEEVEDFPFDTTNLKKLIEENGGICIPKLHGRDLQRANKLICIAKSSSASLPFVYSVTVGTPVLHHDWVHRSIECGSLKPYEKGEYVLPAGKDIFGDVILQDITIREPYTPLKLLRLYVHVDGDMKSQTRLLDMVLFKCGCERFFSSMHVTNKTKKLPFDITKIDYVLTMVDHVPRALVRGAKKADKEIVTATWFVQCIINNNRLDVSDIPAFRYFVTSESVDESVEGEDEVNVTTESIDENTLSRDETRSPEFE